MGVLIYFSDLEYFRLRLTTFGVTSFLQQVVTCDYFWAQIIWNKCRIVHNWSTIRAPRACQSQTFWKRLPQLVNTFKLPLVSLWWLCNRYIVGVALGLRFFFSVQSIKVRHPRVKTWTLNTAVFSLLSFLLCVYIVTVKHAAHIYIFI